MKPVASKYGVWPTVLPTTPTKISPKVITENAYRPALMETIQIYTSQIRGKKKKKNPPANAGDAGDVRSIPET